jgi:GDP-D-mannose 3', 5'-epimerase
MRKIIISGAGGFIGSHFVRYMKQKGYSVTGIDTKKPQFSRTEADRFIIADLRLEKSQKYFSSCDELYMFAADMGGVGYINTTSATIMKNNSLININSLEAAKKNRIHKVFFASSACVYPEYKQTEIKQLGLKEEDSIPADPDTGYGWEKLYTEQLCYSYAQQFSMIIKIARFHNVYGPEGEYKGGREKSPAAICRKVSEAVDGGEIEIWGDGKQTRSYCYIDDCCEGIYRFMNSPSVGPLNIGSDRLISLDGLVDITMKAAGKRLKKRYNPKKPQGVRGRNSDNSFIKKTLKWAPAIPLEKGIEVTYKWIDKQIHSRKK